MTAARTTIVGFALLIAAAQPSHAQQGTPRWGGHVTVDSRGGSSDGRRVNDGRSPPVQRAQQGSDLSGFFGYVPPRGQTARHVPLRRAVLLAPLPTEQAGLEPASEFATQPPAQTDIPPDMSADMPPDMSPDMPPDTSPDMPSDTLAAAQWDLWYSRQPVAQSADQPVVRRGARAFVQAPRTDVPQPRPRRITWP